MQPSEEQQPNPPGCTSASHWAPDLAESSAVPVRIALLGCGNVGAALAELIQARRQAIATRFGVNLQIASVAVRDRQLPRQVDLPPSLFTTDAKAAVSDSSTDIVVELIGGLTPARELLTRALQEGKHVVTANKELIASHGPELAAAARASGARLLFEASVGGAIPLIRALSVSLAGESVQRVMGIVNGTTNYILTRMSEDGVSYEAALAEAQRLGYAEADPSADVEGRDAAAKMAILASIAFSTDIGSEDVYCEGIADVSSDDIVFAQRLGYVIKLLGIAEAATSASRSVAVHVHPAMLPITHPLASVRGSFNAVFVEGEAVGELMLFGRGAGGYPTAGAVLGDIIDAATSPASMPAPTAARPATIRPMEELLTAYYLALEVDDLPGVLAAVAAVFGQHKVSIQSMEQEGLGSEARLIFITHTACERDMRSTIRDLGKLDAVRRVGSLLRVITDE